MTEDDSGRLALATRRRHLSSCYARGDNLQPWFSLRATASSSRRPLPLSLDFDHNPYPAAKPRLGVSPLVGLWIQRDAVRSMAIHPDDAIVEPAPCRYDRRTVERAIDRFRNYKFKQLSGLCEHNLEPLLDHQMGEALRAERGDVAIAMLVPIIDFFNKWSDLDDSYGEGSMFVSIWADKLGDAIERLDDNWENEELIEEVLESIANIPSHWRDRDMDGHCDGLRELLNSSSDDSGDGCEPHSKRAKRYR